MMNQRPPLQGMANQMAQYGRYGDSMLVHMNPVEVQGIAALSPTGSLTTNPVTGQPEAFLPFLAPLLGSALGSSFLTGMALPGILGGGALSSAAAGAIGSGLATTAVTGDIEKGILSGITGFGLGKALGAASDALNPDIANIETALQGTGDTVGAIDTAAQTGAELAGARAELATLPPSATPEMSAVLPPGGGALQAQVNPAMSPVASPTADALSASAVDPSRLAKMQQIQGLESQFAGQQATVDSLTNRLAAERAALTPMERLAAPFAEPGTLI